MGVCGQISGMLILWGGGGRQRLGMFIFSEDGSVWGIRGQTYNIGDVNIGGGPCGGEVTGGRGFGERYGLWGMLIS